MPTCFPRTIPTTSFHPFFPTQPSSLPLCYQSPDTWLAKADPHDHIRGINFLTKEIVGGYGTWMAKRDLKRLVALQDESSKTDNTSEAGSGELASTGSGDGLGLVVGGSDTTGGSRGEDGGGLDNRGRSGVSLLGAMNY